LLLTIEKMIYGGAGLARLAEDTTPPKSQRRGKAIFVPLVLAGEKVEASISEQKPGFARARAESIVEASPHRVSAACPYFSQCGGCHYQHAAYEHQLEIKTEILRETLRRTGKVEIPGEIAIHPSPPWNYRNRSRLQIHTHPKFAAGYFKHASHDLLAVEQCPISSPLINRGIEALWRSGRAGKVPPGVREVEFFANAGDSELLIEIECEREARRADVRSLTEELQSLLPEAAGVISRRKSAPGAANQAENFLAVGQDHLIYRTASASYRVSAGSFFQTNRSLVDELVKIVTVGQSGELALDLYSGVGLFSTALACDFHHIVSVESSQTSSADLAYNLAKNGKVIRATTEQYLARAENSGRTVATTARSEALSRPDFVVPDFMVPDFVVADPPRSGLGASVVRLLAGLAAPQLTYVSCDPSTLARDLAILLASGYRVEQVHLVDLFPQTYHIESVVQLVR
jgi:23S rRNA (uracil1939-C5)-methyltransferase